MRTLRYYSDLCFDPPAFLFYRHVRREGYEPNGHIDVLPEHKLIYVSVPKCASSTIRAALSMLLRDKPEPPKRPHDRKETLLQAPHDGPSKFYRLAKDPATLRFSFVRNPYARLLSAWADKFRGKPLVRGDFYIDKYLDCQRMPARVPKTRALSFRKSQAPMPEFRAQPDASETECAPRQTDDGSLSFADFVRFACSTAGSRLDPHWQLQSDIINVPGVTLDFIGRVETFSADFQRVLDHANAPEAIRNSIRRPASRSKTPGQKSIHAFYTAELAKCVYDAYEQDFDLLGYARALPA